MRQHSARFAFTTLLGTVLLSGCSVWQSIVAPSTGPGKSLQAADERVEVPAPPTIVVAPAEPVVAVSTAPVAVAAAAEVQTLERSSPQAPVETRPSVPTAQTVQTAQAAKAVRLGHGYSINVGLFAVPANAETVRQTLKKAGLPVTTEVVDTPKGKVTRVRVGPYGKRGQADAAARKIRAAKLDAFVFRH